MKFILNSPIKKKQYILIIVDCFIIFSAIFISYVIRLKYFEGRNLSFLGERLHFIIIPVIILYILIFYIFDLYNIERKFSNLIDIFNIAISVIISVLLITAYFYFFPKYRFGRVVLISHSIIIIIFLFFWRVINSRLTLRATKPKNLLFIAEHDEAQFLFDALQKYPFKNFNPIGVISKEKHIIGERIQGISIYSTNINIEKMIMDEDIHALIVSSYTKLPKDLERIALRMKFKGMPIYDSASFYKNLTGKVPIFYIRDMWLLFITGIGSFWQPFYRKQKRLMDIILSLCSLIITSPLLFLSVLIIKLESNGPSFFKQERLGLNQKPFFLIKLRTMKKDAEAKTGPIWAKKNDSRSTFVGKILRKTRVDEIPQFINVLKGDMSVVGPRPIRKVFEDQFAKEIPYYFLRHSIKPGITGWAQTRLSNPRIKEGPSIRLQYDLFYIQEASLLLDLMIILKTIQSILTRPSQ